MDAFEAMLTRRSIRKYTSAKISDEQIKQLLTAAVSAPSAGNRQPWHFLVMDDRTVLNNVLGIIPSFDMLKEAPLAILVCGNLKEVRAGSTIWIQACSAATQNILTAANAMGLGAVWLGVYPDQEKIAALRKLFGLPEGIMPLSMVSLGYPGEHKPREDRYKAEKVHRNRW